MDIIIFFKNIKRRDLNQFIITNNSATGQQCFKFYLVYSLWEVWQYGLELTSGLQPYTVSEYHNSFSAWTYRT